MLNVGVRRFMVCLYLDASCVDGILWASRDRLMVALTDILTHTRAHQHTRAQTHMHAERDRHTERMGRGRSVLSPS